MKVLAAVAPAAVLCSVVSCAAPNAARGVQDVARKKLIERASFDLACGRAELKVLRLSDDKVLVDVSTGQSVTRGLYQVRGCGDVGNYIVDCAGTSEAATCTAQRTNDGPGPPAAAH